MKYYKSIEKAIHKSVKLHIRTGDRVKILAGKYKHKEGAIIKVFPKENRAIVEGVNMMVRHRKPSAGNPKGMIERKEAPIHISNLMLVDTDSGQPTRIGRRYNEAGKLQRYAKKTGNFIKNA